MFDTVYILLVEPTKIDSVVLEEQLKLALKGKIILLRVNETKFESFIEAKSPIYDLVFIGENIDQNKAIQIANSLRGKNFRMPLILLTSQSEAVLTQSQKSAGIDHILNIAEIPLPTFSWTFSSLLKESEVQKKAEEFDTIRVKIRSINSVLAHITHEINNPLGVIRLALFQLQSKSKADEYTAKYVKMISDNVNKLEEQVQALRSAREEMRTEYNMLKKILSLKD